MIAELTADQSWCRDLNLAFVKIVRVLSLIFLISIFSSYAIVVGLISLQ